MCREVKSSPTLQSTQRLLQGGMCGGEDDNSSFFQNPSSPANSVEKYNSLPLSFDASDKE